mgnify:CR=1 FL=1
MLTRRFGAAENDCTDAIALDPTYVKAYIRRGTARQKLKKLQGALDDYSQVMKIDPDNKVAQRSVIQLEQVFTWLSQRGTADNPRKIAAARLPNHFYSLPIGKVIYT